MREAKKKKRKPRRKMKYPGKIIEMEKETPEVTNELERKIEEKLDKKLKEICMYKKIESNKNSVTKPNQGVSKICKRYSGSGCKFGTTVEMNTRIDANSSYSKELRAAHPQTYVKKCTQRNAQP